MAPESRCEGRRIGEVVDICNAVDDDLRSRKNPSMDLAVGSREH